MSPNDETNVLFTEQKSGLNTLKTFLENVFLYPCAETVHTHAGTTNKKT